MIIFKDYEIFNIGELNLVDPKSISSDSSLRVFGRFRILRRIRDKKIIVLLPPKKDKNGIMDFSERSFEISARDFKKSKVNLWSEANLLFFYSPRSARRFLETAEIINISEYVKNQIDYEFFDPIQKIIISR